MDKLYIPGDLVYFGGEKAKVWFRNPSADDSIYVRVIENGGENRIWDASLKEEISPIPLTPEILEKNGWKKLYEKFFEKNVNNIRLTIELSENFYVAINRIFIMEIHYIHELQHLLFGLGLNSEMEV